MARNQVMEGLVGKLRTLLSLLRTMKTLKISPHQGNMMDAVLTDGIKGGKCRWRVGLGSSDTSFQQSRGEMLVA